MLTPNQTVYFTSGPLVTEATFVRYTDSHHCVLRTNSGELTIRESRVFTAEEAKEQGLLRNNTARVREAFAV